MVFSGVDGFALITGAASGIGEEIGYAFAEAGAAGVMFADLNYGGAFAAAEKSKSFATNPNYQALSIKVDVTKAASIDSMVNQTIQKFGRIDYSINSAGVTTGVLPLSEIDPENFDFTLSVNMRGTMLCLRAVTRVMAAQTPKSFKGRHGDERSVGRGCIVNLGSALSYVGAPGMMAYTASKHAVLGMTKVSSLDNAVHQIRVNALCPSWVETSMLAQGQKYWEGLPELVKSASPLGRPAVPEEVANMAVFLCSPSATYINGTGIQVDAGMTATARN